MSLKPGDIAIGIEDLSASVRFVGAAEKDYRRHPATDNWEKMVNQTRSEGAKARREAIERVIAHLAGQLENKA